MRQDWNNLTHFYWGRKPLRGIKEYIFKYTKKEDIILDPFCGAGTVVVEALKERRRIVAIDINPIATFLTRVTITPINLYLLRKKFEEFRDNVSKKILSLYESRCPQCGEKVYFSSAIWKSFSGQPKINEIRIHNSTRYRCQSCSFNGFHKITESENKIQHLKQQIEIPYWFPKTKIKTNLRKPPVKYFYELFTKRNLFCLSLLFKEIEKISDKKIREAFLYIFTDMLYACSKMQMYSPDNPKATRGWSAPRFYLPSKYYQERNVWMVFENKFERFYNAKKILNRDIYSIKISETFEEFLNNNADVLIMTRDVFSLKLPIKLRFKYVYLDPPYQRDIEYLAFSEFWGCWLGHKFDFKNEILPVKNSYLKNIERVINYAFKNITKDGFITFAFTIKENILKEPIWKIIEKSDLEIHDIEPIIYPNPQIRHKQGRGRKITNSYINLKKKSVELKQKEKKFPVRPRNISPEIITDYVLYRYHLWWSSSINDRISTDSIKSKIMEIIPKYLMDLFTKTSMSHLKDELKGENYHAKRLYNTMCFLLLNEIMNGTNWELFVPNKNNFMEHAFGTNVRFPDLSNLYFKEKNWLINNIDIVAFNRSKNQRIHFVFKNRKDDKKLKKISNKIFEIDKNFSKNKKFYSNFKDICVLIFGVDPKKVTSEMERFRNVEKAIYWKRGFFTNFLDLWKVAYETKGEKISHLINEPPHTMARFHKFEKKVKTYVAEVDNNIPVPMKKIQNGTAHFKLRLKIKDLPRILPGQFLLIDCMTKKDIDKHYSSDITVKNLNSILNQTQKNGNRLNEIPLLKRPFGIHRTYYKYFDRDYLKRMDLPRPLSTALHTTFPDIFEIFYRVKEEGVGTNLMVKLGQNNKIIDKINVVGPLGKPIYIDDLLRKYSNFILIGGGTGMAPLVFFAQALKYYSVSVKAFIGIDSFENLKHKDPLARSFTVPGESVYLYIDDLKEIGLENDSIYVSIENGEKDKISKISEIPIKNIHKGFITKQFEKYVNEKSDKIFKKKMCIVACGPTKMMETIHQITKQQEIPLMVYLEQRMACGIGVCLSCVQQIKRNDGKKDYKRICIEGPIFDANEIVWNV